MLREYVEALETVDDDQALDDSRALLPEARQAMEHADRLPAERHHWPRTTPAGSRAASTRRLRAARTPSASSMSPAIARPAMSSALVAPASSTRLSAMRPTRASVGPKRP